MILHADMDAFYASVEQNDHPELRGRPVIVGGLGNRGVVTTASYEARPFGVRSAMPMVEARRLCPQAVFLPGRMSRYSEVSRAIRQVFHEFTPLVEPLSLDEAFLDVTGSQRLFGQPLELGRELKVRVRAATGLTVSVGVGPSRMVAKIASDLGKPDGLLEVRADRVEEFLRPLPVRRLWGIGPVAAQRLAHLGIETIGDLADDHGRLEESFGSQAQALRALARGIDPRPVDPESERQSYGEENTFATDLGDGESLRATIVGHAEAVAHRLRVDGRRARTVVLKLKLARRLAPGRYPLKTRSRTLPEATQDGKTIADLALSLWNEVPRGTVVRLIGVSVTNLESAETEGQLDLFASRAVARRDALNHALDRIASRFGDDAVTRGVRRAERAAPTLSLKRPRSES